MADLYEFVMDRENPNKTYLQYNRMLGMSERGNVLCVDRDLNGTLYGPTSGPGMMNDINFMLQFVMQAMPEYSSLRITFEILDKKEDVIESNIGAEEPTE